MTETFYGTWKITSGHVDNFPPHRFTINGSIASDGLYNVTTGHHVAVRVEGPQWTVTLEQEGVEPTSSAPAWHPMQTSRTSQFDAASGTLVVRLVGHRDATGTLAPTSDPPGITISCVLEDTDVAVPPPHPPVDLTLPGG